MIIIYQGARPFIPSLACRIQCDPALELTRIQSACSDDHNWKEDPFAVIGTDHSQNVICCLVHGRYAKLYRRAVEGIAGIFSLPVRIVDVDELVAASWPAQTGIVSRIFMTRLPSLAERFQRETIYGLLKEAILSAQEDPN